VEKIFLEKAKGIKLKIFKKEMEGDIKHSQERGKELEGKFNGSGRALRVEPELSVSWRQNIILHRSLAEQKMSVQTKQAENKGQEKRFIKRSACQVKAEKISAV